jgi:PAS domain S-box-containing protein
MEHVDDNRCKRSAAFLTNNFNEWIVTMNETAAVALDPGRLAAALEKLPVGITIIDPEGHILYYNEYSSKVVDRKPEYLGKDIRTCHQHTESIEKIDKIFSDLKAGKSEEFRYEAERGGVRLRVTVSPFEFEGRLIGFVQSFIVLQGSVPAGTKRTRQRTE